MNTQLQKRHPYLTGNFAPVKRELALTHCRILHGNVPDELGGGQYVRNGGNPFNNDDQQRQAHWFDGDGMLTGILFRKSKSTSNDGKEDDKERIEPCFINKFILTDVLLTASSSTTALRRPILPSIAMFAAPFSLVGLVNLLTQIMRALLLAIITFVSPWHQLPPMKQISTANTSIWWHDGQAYAGCESGPPIKILLPGLETAEWWTGESQEDTKRGSGQKDGWSKPQLGPMKLLSEFTTAHPRIDPVTNELLLFHMSFVAPYLRVSVIPSRNDAQNRPALLGVPVTPGIRTPKLAHDFCATQTHTILIDMPLTLDPRNLLHGKPMLSYEGGANAKTRFGIMPRRRPDKLLWYESEACCIYHAANSWDEDVVQEHFTGDGLDSVRRNTVVSTNVHLVACRLNSATLVYAAGNLDVPAHAKARNGDEEKCQLYYWQFSDVPSTTSECLGSNSDADNDTESSSAPAHIVSEFALSEIPFEFPSMDDMKAQRKNTYVYGASMTSGSFDAGLGARTAKIDCLAKVNIERLIQRGNTFWQQGKLAKGEAVDKRSVKEILKQQDSRQQRCATDHNDIVCDKEMEDDIQLFSLPDRHYAQEATFVARKDAQREDDGYLVFFVFDESNGLNAHDGSCKDEANSQLWILDARSMQRVACIIDLPQRVPYGLHGHFFSENDILSQRPIDADQVRNWALSKQQGSHHRQDIPSLGEVFEYDKRLLYVRGSIYALQRQLARVFGR